VRDRGPEEDLPICVEMIDEILDEIAGVIVSGLTDAGGQVARHEIAALYVIEECVNV
jgi:hypothetical protein